MMDPFLQFLLALVIILPVAKGSGYLSNRLGQPAVLGELLIGLLLGPTLLDMLHWSMFSDTHLGETLRHLAHLGVLLLMFIAGLEVDLKAMLQAGRPAVLAGILGVVTPIGLGMLALLPFDFGPQRGFFIGLVLAATSVSISAQTLMELGVFRSRVGGAVERGRSGRRSSALAPFRVFSLVSRRKQGDIGYPMGAGEDGRLPGIGLLAGSSLHSPVGLPGRSAADQ
jgi:Kef-type K+ transport system membrane component KefB